jgi:hypothetical protein
MMCNVKSHIGANLANIGVSEGSGEVVSAETSTAMSAMVMKTMHLLKVIWAVSLACTSWSAFPL